MNGVINRLFCAECLPLTVNHGCYILGYSYWLRYHSRFLLAEKTKKYLIIDNFVVKQKELFKLNKEDV